MSKKWKELRGIEVVTVSLGSVTLPEVDQQLIKSAQHSGMLKDPTMAAATLVEAQAEAMKAAAGNKGGAMTGFMGMGMAMNAGGVNPQNLYAMGQNTPKNEAANADSWKCSCGATVSGKFCPECGTKRPEGWVCSCGTLNKGRFCSECGAKKPADQPLYKCDKCGWEPEDPHNPPKFCPECGDRFDDSDKQ